MSFEIGKIYAVSPSKYNYQEKETWVNGDKRVELTTVWKSGSVNITPQNQDEVLKLEVASNQEDDGSFDPYDFEYAEFQASFDGSTEVDDVRGFSEEEELDGTIDEVWDGVDEQGEAYLDDSGYHVEESETSFYGEITIEEI
jgi:hypothetical protein